MEGDKTMDLIIDCIIWLITEIVAQCLIWGSGSKNERIGCVCIIVLLIVLLFMGGVILWVAFS